MQTHVSHPFPPTSSPGVFNSPGLIICISLSGAITNRGVQGWSRRLKPSCPRTNCSSVCARLYLCWRGFKHLLRRWLQPPTAAQRGGGIRTVAFPVLLHVIYISQSVFLSERILCFVLFFFPHRWVSLSPIRPMVRHHCSKPNIKISLQDLDWKHGIQTEHEGITL